MEQDNANIQKSNLTNSIYLIQSELCHSVSRIVIIAGATAIGKSDISIKLAQNINGEIISADSMQIYKGLDIGTGKITEEEKCGIVHYMLDILNPEESFSVEQFVSMCKKNIDIIIKKGKVPIIVGGTGLYINALLNGHNFAEAKPNDIIRKKYQDMAQSLGNESIYTILKNIDSDSAAKISINDTKRIIRALEIFETTGVPKSQKINKQKSEYNYKMFVLNIDREKLYHKINARVDKMFSNGLLDEVKQFLSFKNSQSMQAIGYKEIVSMFENNISLNDTIELVKKNSRHYAKRQLTYFRWIDAEKQWIDNSNTDIALKEILENL